MTVVWLGLSLLWMLGEAAEIKLIECKAPNFPSRGGYAPLKEEYFPGDIIHYFCETDALMSGNFHRSCQGNGQWSGQTPMCDIPTEFKYTAQSSDKDDRSSSDMAVDGQRRTCSETAEGERGEWVGNFRRPGKLIKLLMFLPPGSTSYDVFVVKENGLEILCSTYKQNREHLGWINSTCSGPSALNDIGIIIRSPSLESLKICELAAYVLTSPNCKEPRVYIENGHLLVNRKRAILVCNKGFYTSENDVLECIEDGRWSNKDLKCLYPEWELYSRESSLREMNFERIREVPAGINVDP